MTVVYQGHCQKDQRDGDDYLKIDTVPWQCLTPHSNTCAKMARYNAEEML